VSRFAQHLHTQAASLERVLATGVVYEDAGEHELRGVPDRWHLYRVVS
jgi:hypothetical protein